MSWRVRDARPNCVEEIGSSATHASKRTLIHAPWGTAARHLRTPEHLLSSVSQVKWPGKHSTVRPPNCTTPRALGEAAHTHTFLKPLIIPALSVIAGADMVCYSQSPL